MKMSAKAVGMRIRQAGSRCWHTRPPAQRAKGCARLGLGGLRRGQLRGRTLPPTAVSAPPRMPSGGGRRAGYPPLSAKYGSRGGARAFAGRTKQDDHPAGTGAVPALAARMSINAAGACPAFRACAVDTGTATAVRILPRHHRPLARNMPHAGQARLLAHAARSDGAIQGDAAPRLRRGRLGDFAGGPDASRGGRGRGRGGLTGQGAAPSAAAPPTS